MDPHCDAHPQLQRLRVQLREIYNAMGEVEFAKLSVKPPMLDSSISLDGASHEEFHSHQDAVQGLRALRDAVKRDLDVLEKFLDDPACASMPALSTNAPYLMSVWNEVLHAPQPVVTIWQSFSEIPQPKSIPHRGSRKPSGVKVDVVADGGKRWIRVNTTKNSRLQSEFRELDSYLTDSEDELSDGEARPSLAPKEFDNSILRMGRSLLDAARRNPVPGSTKAPSITLRLTRLDPSSANPKEHDPRIAQTIQHLRDMGIDVELGERGHAHLSQTLPAPPRRLKPTIRVNLDLSVLIALISDITHSPLPRSPAEADARYVPSLQHREWKHKACKGSLTEFKTYDTKVLENGVSEHSRALANQALQEMARGLLHELHDRLVAVSPPNLEDVQFWTTPEARDRCLRIVLSKIGGPNEKRRVAALFPAPGTPLSEAESAYWENSRYPKAFLPLLPIRVFESSVPPHDLHPSPSAGGRVLSPFFALLSRTCRHILSQESLSAEEQSSVSIHSAEVGADHRTTGDEHIERAAVTKANPRLTEHTVQSLLCGAAHGWTTLTANKSSVKAILREIRAAEGGYGWFGTNDQGSAREGEGEATMVSETAAIWVVDPRSLAEGMRSDFQE
ncbi:hypothetical protein C2E23DRAFT_726166 [Lenzites betulinus]|nr:hypothetical protein C2E23DRAFT_726166 [Lenzites betulinus]